MPRRRPRFSALERQFRESGGVAAPGSRLAGYIDFKKGINKIKVEKTLTAAQRKRFGYAIIPFGKTPDSTTPKRYAAAITGYSQTARAGLNLTDGRLGYERIDAGTVQDDNFYPALIRVFVKSADTKTPKVSDITKESYKRLPGSSYSFPFGRTITGTDDSTTGTSESTIDTVDAEDVRKSLSTFIRGQQNVTSVSYEPEVFKVGKQDLVSPPSANP